jgi:hypothetical protein
MSAPFSRSFINIIIPAKQFLLTCVLNFVFHPLFCFWQEMVDRSEMLASAQVGWCEPDKLPTSLAFNVHLKMNSVTFWRVVVDYDDFTKLDSTLKGGSPKGLTCTLPVLGLKEVEDICAFLQIKHFDGDKIKVLDSLRVSIEAWINGVFSNIAWVHSETRRMCRNMFFKSYERMNIFDEYMRSKGIFDTNSLTSIEEGDDSRLTTGNLSLLMPLPHDVSELALNENNLHHTTGKQKKKEGTVNSDALSTASKKSRFPKWLSGGNKAKSVVSDELVRTTTAEDAAIVAMSGLSKTHSVMKVEVHRGKMAGAGVHVHQVVLRVCSTTVHSPLQPIVYRTYQRYSAFRQLWLKLTEINDKIVKAAARVEAPTLPGEIAAEPNYSQYVNFVQLISAPFPTRTMSFLGAGLTEAEHLER